MVKTITTNTTLWMKKGMIIWHGISEQKLYKVVKVIDQHTAEIRLLYFWERWLNAMSNQYHLKIRNRVVRWWYRNEK